MSSSRSVGPREMEMSNRNGETYVPKPIKDDMQPRVDIKP